MKVVKSDQELISLVDNDNKKDAIKLLQKSNSFLYLILPIILSLFIILTSYQYHGLQNTIEFNKWMIIAIGLNIFIFQINRDLSRKELIETYLKNKNIKYKSSIFEKLDSLILIGLIVAFIFI